MTACLCSQECQGHRISSTIGSWLASPAALGAAAPVGAWAACLSTAAAMLSSPVAAGAWAEECGWEPLTGPSGCALRSGLQVLKRGQQHLSASCL